MLYRLPLTLIVVLFFFGCQRMTGPSEILDNIPFMKSSVQKEGESALVAGEYDRAVALLQQAADEDPEDGELQETLSLAMDKAAKMHLLNAQVAEKNKELRLAVEESEKAVGYSEDPLYRAQLIEARKRYEDVSSQVTAVMAGLSEGVDRAETLERAETLMVYEASFPGLAPAIQRARRDAGEELSAEAALLLEQQKFSAALSTAKEALRLSEDKRYEKQVKAYKAMALSERRRHKEDYLTALSAVDRAGKILPGDPAIASYRDALVTTGSQRLSTLASKALKEEKYLVAIRGLEMLKKIDPDHKEVDTQLQHTRLRFSEINRLEAQRLQEREGDDAAGRILMHYLIAQRYDPDVKALEAEVTTARGRLDAEVQMRVFIDLTNASTSADVQKSLRTKVLRALGEPAIDNLTILRREAISKILHEEEMLKKSPDDLIPGQARKAIRGVQLGVKGVVSQVTVQEVGRDKQSYRTVRYQKGTKAVLTPEARKRQVDVDLAQKEVEKAQKAWKDAEDLKRKKLATDDPSKSAFENSLVLQDQTYAENDVHEARKILEEARAKLDIAKSKLITDVEPVEEPVYVEALYPVYDLSLIGDVRLAFRLIDLSTSQIGREHQVHINEKVSDRYIPGDKLKGVVEDPNDLPSVEVFKERLLERAAKESAHRLRMEFAAYSKQYFDRAQRKHKEGDDAEAAEEYVRFLTSISAQEDDDIDEAETFLQTYFGVKVLP